MKETTFKNGNDEGTILVSQSSVPLAMNKDDLSRLRERVSLMLKQDVGALGKIRPLIKTEETLDRSLGEVYAYLADRKKCAKCTGSLFECPRKKQGYHLSPFYEKYDDRIRYAETACPYLVEVDSILSRIDPCDCTPNLLYSDSNTLLSSLLSGDNIRKQQGLSKVFLYALKDIEEDGKGRRKGYAFTTPEGGKHLSGSLLRLIGYHYAKAEKKVSYINSMLFMHLFRKGGAYAVTVNDYRIAMNSEVLLIEDIDEMPFLEEENVVKYLLPLFESRKKEGKITYLSFSSSQHVYSFLYKGRLLAQTKDRLFKALGDIVEEVVIHDFDLR